MSDDDDELERAKQAEQKQMSDIDKLMRELEKLKSERQTKKMDVDAMEELIGKARREVGKTDSLMRGLLHYLSLQNIMTSIM